MSFAEAYRAVTAATPQCAYRRPGTTDEIIPECLRQRSDAPAYVQWTIPVMGMMGPDQCLVELDDAGRVARVGYDRASTPEW
jgi:hypothetical protein